MYEPQEGDLPFFLSKVLPAECEDVFVSRLVGLRKQPRRFVYDKEVFVDV